MNILKDSCLKYCRHVTLLTKITIIMAALSFSSMALALTEEVVHILDFSNQPDGDAKEWLIKQGYLLELDAEKLDMQFTNGQLEIGTKDNIAGLVILKLNKNKWLHDIKFIDIEWGVTKQPEGADWGQGKNRVSIALMFFFGDKSVSSGLPFGINAAPYFISPFIGNLEEKGKTYTGKLYTKGGRYVCAAVTEGGEELINTRLQIDPRFVNEFETEKIPPITGVAFQMNTKDTRGGANSFIKKITFIAEQKLEN